MSTLLRPSRRGHWALAILGGVIVLLGLVLLAGGAWLAALGGSWYYAPAGLAMLIAGVLLFRGRNAGAWWFAAVVVATLLWTWWESGSDYWRWVPRLGLIVGLAFVLALLLPSSSARCRAPSRAAWLADWQWCLWWPLRWPSCRSESPRPRVH